MKITLTLIVLVVVGIVITTFAKSAAEADAEFARLWKAEWENDERD